jgi:hypothetical protein
MRCAKPDKEFLGLGLVVRRSEALTLLVLGRYERSIVTSYRVGAPWDAVKSETKC